MATSTGPIVDSHSKQHTGPTKLEDQAALAALYVTKYDNTKTGQEYLDSNNKLSSAGMYLLTPFIHDIRSRCPQAQQHPSNTRTPRTFPAIHHLD